MAGLSRNIHWRCSHHPVGHIKDQHFARAASTVQVAVMRVQLEVEALAGVRRPLEIGQQTGWHAQIVALDPGALFKWGILLFSNYYFGKKMK